MARKIVFVEVPYVGVILAEGTDWKFGFKELLKPDCEVEFYLGREGKEKMKECVKANKSDSDAMLTIGGIEGGSYAGAGVASAAGGVLAGTVFFPIAVVGGALAWKGAGKKRALKRIGKKLENGESIKSLDLSEFYEMGKEIDEMNLEYAALGQARQESFGNGPKAWARRNFSKYEDDEMRDYRTDVICPIYRKLEKQSLERWEETGEKAYYHMYEAYAKVLRSLGTKKRL